LYVAAFALAARHRNSQAFALRALTAGVCNYWETPAIC